MTTAGNGPLIGCIADDFTGATDLASMLVRGGMRTVQTIGVPVRDMPVEADHILGDLLSRAANGNDRSLLRIAYAHLKAYEARRKREAATRST